MSYEESASDSYEHRSTNFVREAFSELLHCDGFLLTRRTITVPEAMRLELDAEKILVTAHPDRVIACIIEKPELEDIALRREHFFALPNDTVTGFEVEVRYTDEEKTRLANHEQEFATWVNIVEELDNRGILSVDIALENLNRMLEGAITNMMELIRAVELGYLTSEADPAQSFEERATLLRKSLDASLRDPNLQESEAPTSLDQQYAVSFRRLINSFKDIMIIRADILRRVMAETTAQHDLARTGEQGALDTTAVWNLIARLDKYRDF